MRLEEGVAGILLGQDEITIIAGKLGLTEAGILSEDKNDKYTLEGIYQTHKTIQCIGSVVSLDTCIGIARRDHKLIWCKLIQLGMGLSLMEMLMWILHCSIFV